MAVEKAEPSSLGEIAALVTAVSNFAWPIVAATVLYIAWKNNWISAIGASIREAAKTFSERGGEIGAGPINIKIPAPIASGATRVVTADSRPKPESDRAKSIRQQLELTNPLEGIIGFYPYLLHEATEIVPRTRPKTGRWSVRVWVEFDTSFGFHRENIEKVIYVLDDTFSNRVIETSAVETDFELWLSVYGEFTIVSCVIKKDGTEILLERYLNLPGRPPD